MGLKPKHSKQLKKNKAKRQQESKRNESDIDFDTSAYVVYNRLDMTYPCLSFDVVPEEREDIKINFPFSVKLIAGAQTPANVENNYIYVIKADNIKALKQENNEENDEDDENEDDDEDPSNLPKLSSLRVSHKGCVNRLRLKRVNGKMLTGTWSDKGKVHIYDLTTTTRAVDDLKSINTYVAQKIDPKPIFTFGGHLSEGYAIDWSPFTLGSLATGDCKKNIHIWTMRNQADWMVNQIPLVGHEESVEDIRWSPEDADVLASCSVDKSVRVWDLRLGAEQRCVAYVTNGHKSDVNVIDWNRRNKDLLVSGGDDGVVKVWDIRFLKRDKDNCSPVSQFSYHKGPITSVQWNPNDETSLAVASEDDRLTLWDISAENDDNPPPEQEVMEVDGKKESDLSSSSDEEESDDDEEIKENDEDKDDNMQDDEEKLDEDGVEYGDLNFKEIPEQMLFLHQGQAEIKELHWHPQFDGLLISTAANGINIFKTISA